MYVRYIFPWFHYIKYIHIRAIKKPRYMSNYERNGYPK